MDRRTFAQRLAASSLGLLASDVTNPSCAADEPPKRGDSADQGPDEPVRVADFQALAAAKLPKATYEYVTAGSADEVTLRENVAAFQRIRILPPLLTGVATADPSTTVLKQPIQLPIMLAPVAAQRMYHPQGALAAARAATAAGTVFAVSSSVGQSAEEVAAASSGPKWFQLYVPKDREVARKLVQRVERAGYRAIVVTVDLGEWKDADRRNRFTLPKEMLVKHLRDVGYTHVSNDMSYQQVIDFNAQAWDLALSWEFFDWPRSITKLPLLIKGVLRTEDALKAVSLGLDGIIVSNHGGRRLDGMPASIDMLPDSWRESTRQESPAKSGARTTDKSPESRSKAAGRFQSDGWFSGVSSDCFADVSRREPDCDSALTDPLLFLTATTGRGRRPTVRTKPISYR